MSQKIAHFPLDFSAEQSVCGGERTPPLWTPLRSKPR